MTRINKQGKILLYGVALWSLGEGMLGPLFAIFTERLGGDVLDISWAWATYLILMGVLMVVFGKMADKKNIKEEMLVASFALNTVATFGYLFVSQIWHLFVVQAILGVAASMLEPSWASLYAEYEDKKSSGYSWGLAGANWSIFSGIALIIGGFIVKVFSFEVLFITMGIVQLIATISQIRILKYKKA